MTCRSLSDFGDDSLLSLSKKRCRLVNILLLSIQLYVDIDASLQPRSLLSARSLLRRNDIALHHICTCVQGVTPVTYLWKINDMYPRSKYLPWQYVYCWPLAIAKRF